MSLSKYLWNYMLSQLVNGNNTIILPLQPYNLLKLVSTIVNSRCHTNTGCRVFRVHTAPYGFLIQWLRYREAIFYFFNSLPLKYRHNMAALIMLHLFSAHKGSHYEFQFQCLYYGRLCCFSAFWNVCCNYVAFFFLYCVLRLGGHRIENHFCVW